MAPSALVILRRASLFAFSLALFVVTCLRDNAQSVLVAAQALSGVRSSANAKLALSFEPNLGQADPRVKFLSRGPGYTLFLAQDEAVVALWRSRARRQDSGFRIQDSGIRRQKSGEERSQLTVVRGQSHETREGGRGARLVKPHSSLQLPAPSAQPLPPSFLSLKLLRANPTAKVTGTDELPGKSNYLIGNDPNKWRTNVPTYGRVRYENVYPGVDLVYYGKQDGQLEYDFVVAPGADPGALTLAIDNGGQVNSALRTADSTESKIQNRKSKISSPLRIASNGDLIVPLPGGELRFHKPVVYQTESTVNSRQSTVENRQTTTDHGQPPAANPRSKIQNPKLRSANPKSKIQN
jgi:hypothetical protein